jgi:hypothetical protein
MTRRPSYASVISTLALFIALGGTGYAAVDTTHASVRTGQLRSGVAASAPLGYAHLVVHGTASVDPALSYGITDVSDAGSIQPSNERIVCVYGTITPHAVSATVELQPSVTSPPGIQVDIADPWMIGRCPQTTQGRVVAVVTLPLAPPGGHVKHGTRASRPPVPGPDPQQTGAFLVFY